MLIKLENLAFFWGHFSAPIGGHRAAPNHTGVSQAAEDTAEDTAAVGGGAVGGTEPGYTAVMSRFVAGQPDLFAPEAAPEPPRPARPPLEELADILAALRAAEHLPWPDLTLAMAAEQHVPRLARIAGAEASPRRSWMRPSGCLPRTSKRRCARMPPRDQDRSSITAAFAGMPHHRPIRCTGTRIALAPGSDSSVLNARANAST